MEKHDLLEVALDAVERLMAMFSVERYVYLALSVLSFFILIYTGHLYLSRGAVTDTALIAIGGSTGLLTVACVRTTWFFGRAFGVIENLIKRLSP